MALIRIMLTAVSKYSRSDLLYLLYRLFPCDHGAATHSCIMHDTGRGTLCKNAKGCHEGTSIENSAGIGQES